ncbi:hypothetical protein EGW08_002427 [Elysia chlorotica]|uniref:Uncharacterized protein n=1 Tax=Elysia chlorotica TaxID=188477 RepID=A0A3S1CDL6_ELYCH|nr:hypothetical protein EGW08_002427 [Elysia chlorotica]
MVLLTQKALFDAVDPRTNQISEDADLRMKVFKHHFRSNNALPNYLSHSNDTIKLDPKAKWEIKSDRSWAFMSRKITGNMYFVVPLRVEEGSDSIIVLSNLTNPEWLCYCDIPAGKTSCDTCTSLSAHSRLLTPLYSNTKYARLSFSDFEVTNDTHIVISVPAGQKKVSIISDRYNSDERHLVYHLPSSWDSVISYPISATDGAAMLRIQNQSVFYSLHLSGLAFPSTAYRALVLPLSCRKHSSESYEGSVLRLNVPWSNEETYSFSSYGKMANLMLKLQTPRPPSLAWDWHLDDAVEPHLEMFLHPYCHYQLRLVASAPDSLGQMVRFYGPLVPAYLVAILMLVIAEVLISTGKGQAVTYDPPETIINFSNLHYLIGFVMVLKFLLSFSLLKRLVYTTFGLPLDDFYLLEQEGIYFMFLPALLCACAFAATYLQTSAAFHFLGMLSYVGRLFWCVPESLLAHAKLVQVMLSVTAMSMTFLCGTAGLLLSAGLLILKVLRLLYLTGRRLDSRETHTSLALLFPVTLVVNLQAMLSMGCLVMWLKSETLLTPLSPDPSRIPGLLTSAGVGVLLFFDNLVLSRWSDRLFGWGLRVLAVRAVMYASESLYRLPYLVSLALALLLLSRLTNHLMRPRQVEGKAE